MDDFILQILRANNVAKVQVKQTLESHADDIQKLQEKKDAIDTELQIVYEKAIAQIETEYDAFKTKVAPVYQEEYDKRVLDLDTRFKDAKTKWYQTLLEGIITPDGQ